MENSNKYVEFIFNHSKLVTTSLHTVGILLLLGKSLSYANIFLYSMIGLTFFILITKKLDLYKNLESTPKQDFSLIIEDCINYYKSIIECIIDVDNLAHFFEVRRNFN